MKRYTIKTFILELSLISIASLFLFPIYILVNLAVREIKDLDNAYKPTFKPTLANFKQAWIEGGLFDAITNSAIVTISSVLLIVLFASFSSYPLARITAKWSRATFFFIVGGLMIPYQLALLPLYTTFRDLHLLGGLPALVIFYVGREMPFSIFLYTAFLRNIPKEYEEAAEIDGAGRVRTFAYIVLPLLRPVTGTVIILTGVFVYNDFFTPLLYLSGSGSQTTTVALSGFVGEYRSYWNLVFAGLIMSSAPILILFFTMQKTVIKGFGGGLKG
jgi:raffinose/stachyose/melibiose transport system permease protein